MMLTKFPRAPLLGEGRPKGRRINQLPEGSWTEPILIEWELTGESWTDLHPHTEYVFVLEGRLFVESGGETVECVAGDTARVAADATGRYWAPEHARMLTIYGPNPEGKRSELVGFVRLAADGEEHRRPPA